MEAIICFLECHVNVLTVAATTFPPVALSVNSSLKTDTLFSSGLTSGTLSAVSMANPGPKPVSDLTLVVVGSGRLH